ncbi:MAG: exopolysaccharide biosynthesis protein [Methyloceanibacter sp.]|uniref:exopolysaccharide biosynthesis protein n=1 Tax=Methyloceanibacter sp. TaxID=1965321 RepID=UPI003D6CDA46
MSAQDVFPPALPVAAAARPHGGKLSDILNAVAADQSRQRVSIADLFEVMRDRAFGALMLIFAAPNVLPLPPGTSTVLGAPLIFLAAQLALGRPRPWLPKLMAARSMSREDFAITIGRVTPWLVSAERLLKPRLSFLTRPPFEQVIGVICLVLAIILFLPIPLGNMPPALAICLFALAILERDGLAALSGALVAVLSVAIVWGVLYTLIKSAIFVIGGALSL